MNTNNIIKTERFRKDLEDLIRDFGRLSGLIGEENISESVKLIDDIKDSEFLKYGSRFKEEMNLADSNLRSYFHDVKEINNLRLYLLKINENSKYLKYAKEHIALLWAHTRDIYQIAIDPDYAYEVSIIDCLRNRIKNRIYRNLELDLETPAIRTTNGQLKSMIECFDSNAFKAIEYSGNEMCEISVTLKYLKNKKVIKLTFADTGAGMSEETKEKLFHEQISEFKTMGDSPVLTSSEGIGMFNIYKYTKSLGGEISFNSKKGKGTRFKIAIPVDE